MKLNELNPKWIVAETFDEQLGIKPKRHGMGIRFDCPTHKDHKLAVMFSNPIDGGLPCLSSNLWLRHGDTFDTLTLSPSIDASRHKFGENGQCWHGFIVNGFVQ